MKRFAYVMALVLTLCLGVSAQQQQFTQQFTVVSVPVPPPIVNSQTYSTTTGTGVTVVSTGGTVAAGTWRICLQYYTNAVTTTGSPCSVDTATTSVVTTTGSTSQIIIAPPNTTGVPANVTGYVAWVGASAGAAGAEVLQTPTAANCTTSPTTTISCSLLSPITFTSSAGFGAGTAPTTYAAFYPAIGQAAFTSVYENSVATTHTLNWVVSGTAPTACTVQLQSGSTVAGLSNVGNVQTCTSTGSYTLEGSSNTFFAINLSAFTVSSDGTSVVAFYYSGLPFTQVGQLQDGTYWVPIGGACIWSTTGTIGTVIAGTGADPGLEKTASGNYVYYINTTTNNSAVTTLACDITPPARVTAGKLIRLTSIDLYTAPVFATVTITPGTPTINSITYPALGVSTTLGTVVTTLGGTLVLNPSAWPSTTATAGLCFHENISAAAANPILMTTGNNIRYTIQEGWTASGSTAVQEFEVCGVAVNYSYNPI